MNGNRQVETQVTPGACEAPSTHPLAAALTRALAAGSRALLVGVGSGRHVPALLAAGLDVDAIEDDAERAAAATRRFAGEPRVRVVHGAYRDPFPLAATYAGALATHAFLHGTVAAIAAALRATRERLRPGAPLYLTLGSTRDPRFGRGTPLGDATFAPRSGREAGVPHTYVDAAGARALLRDFVVDELAEREAGEHVGRWAHDDAPAERIVQWFVRARRQ